MKAVFVLFDSLNRRMLGPYGGTKVPTPNFDRLAERTRVYEQHYVGSLPCMPARRDMQTGRLSFLHRSWGPIEPFDNSFPEILRQNNIHSHLTTDHYHYWEDGGATYHNRYSTFEFSRGQECDPWHAIVKPDWASLREKFHPAQFSDAQTSHYKAYMINREFIREEEDFPAAKTFRKGLEFLDTNRDSDDWLLQIETFDPHEPFFAPDRFKAPFATGWNGPIRDWPRYGRVEELPEEADELRANYYATLAHCDYLLGKLLDYFDEHEMWQDTALIVTTDHGFLLGEHDFWAKNRMLLYQELVNIPLFVHDPRAPQAERISRLTQSIDIAPTMLDLFNIPFPPEFEGISLMQEEVERKALIYGYFGAAVNITDGRYTYHRYPADIHHQEIYQYTVMPTHIATFFSPEELSQATLVPPFSWSKSVPLLKVPVIHRSPMYQNYGPGCLLEDDTRLYDLQTDPGQTTPIQDGAVEERLAQWMVDLMKANDAPAEAFSRLALT